MDRSSMIEEVREALARHPGPAKGLYSEEVMAVTVRHARALRAAGLPWLQVAAGLPMSCSAIQVWTRRDDERRALRIRPRASELRPVEVVAKDVSTGSPSPSGGTPSSAVLTTPQGYRVDGLGVAELLELLRVLG